VEQPVAAGLTLDRQREGRVGVDVDALDRVHLDRDGEAHAGLLKRPAEYSRPRD
jgi:hypothetical protein